MSNIKLGVEVISAHDLFHRDKQNSCSPFVELKFDNQIFRTTTKPNDPNPVWHESFFFLVPDPSFLSTRTLEAHVYSYQDGTDAKPFLGKVRVNGTSFVPRSEAAPFNYPLEKRSVFSRARGELGLRVFITDEPSITPSFQESPRAYIPSPRRSEPVRSSLNTADANMMSAGGNRTELTKPKTRTLYNVTPSVNQQQPTTMNYGMQEMREAPPRVVQYNGPAPPSDFSVKETSPLLGGGQIIGGRVVRGTKRLASGTYDLVEEMRFLFVRIVKARDLPDRDLTGSLDPFVEVKIGNFKGVTTHLDKNSDPEWNQVFAFAKENLQSNVLEIVVKDKDLILDDYVGTVRFDLNEVQSRVPPDSPLAPEWYRLENKRGEKKRAEIMLAVWEGTQADEAFGDAVFSDSLTSSDTSNIISANLRSKVYHSPRLWYLRVRIIEAQDVIIVSDKSRPPEAFVRIQIGNQMLKTRVSQRTFHPTWDQEFMFVVAEPFEENLVLSVEDQSAPNRDEPVGKAVIPLAAIEKRVDDKKFRSRWFHLEDSISDAMDEDKAKKVKFATRIHVAAALEGGYHVFDESTYYSSDLRPTAKPLWKKQPIGVLELGILNANGLHPVKTRDGKGVSDTYVVAKYGHKWVRSRTVINSLSPKYNEQYTWEVFDPATVLTICVFDNGHFSAGNGRDTTIGKVRIRLSTLQSGRVYTNAYPLLVLQPSGLKKRGELHLAVRFTCTSVSNMLMKYTKPLLPKMHYTQPLSVNLQEMLRVQALNIMVARLGRSEPPLRREVVEYMTDAKTHLFSMRRSKANFYRFTAVFSGVMSVWKWMGQVCSWRTPVTTALVHVLYTMLVMFPEMILPTVFLYMAVIGLWNYRFRPRFPPHMDTKLSYAESVNADELDEEFDIFPTMKDPDIVKRRYDRLRIVAGKIQSVVGDIAAQGERVQALLSWRDPRATAIFVTFCLIIAMVLYITPFKLFAILSGYYFMRHPRLRHRIPSTPLNFFRRLPAMTDSML
ncbi:C2 calcium/lipid-binding plant phosphoribosyltransferase family protein [Raphanus sativus]|uniref:Multiple C2 domain and transmembrane region protein 5-like n=1 Tax=Raphanus sativus TaxID=3726 RepID=A0A6J0MEK0_RAPSA|nr:multiple C2 domain and transmembrane region protein 5-like [Raphanus sativus]KAJ4910286.1 C2 calcium/lipid-binding plant phosphoribosyltransferase family protein [Raphanus sativus]